MNETIREWLDRAEGDYLASEQIFLTGKELSYPTACVLCQQAVEKFLKALLIMNSVEFPKIHDLVKLYKLVKNYVPDLNLSEEELDWLTDTAWTARYPEGVIIREDMEKAFQITKSIRQQLLPYFEEKDMSS